MSAAGGTSVPLMLDWLMWLSMPKVNAECENPENTTSNHVQKQQQNMCIRRRVLIQTGLKAVEQKETNAITSMTFESLREADVNADHLGILQACIWAI